MKDPTRELFSVEELLFIPLSGQEYSMNIFSSHDLQYSTAVQYDRLPPFRSEVIYTLSTLVPRFAGTCRETEAISRPYFFFGNQE